MSEPRHPNKEIRAAVEDALARGWTLVPGGPPAHAWGQLRCPFGQRGGCQKSVYSTPRKPEAHAAEIRRYVNRCPHQAGED